MSDIAAFYAWQPPHIPEGYTLQLRLEPGNWGDHGYCFACIVGRSDKEPDQIPVIVVHAWSDSPDEAQFYAYKRAAYFIEHGYLPPAIQMGRIEDRLNPQEFNGRQIIPQYDYE